MKYLTNKNLTLLLFLCALAVMKGPSGSYAKEPEENGMKIQIHIKGQATILTATLENNSAGKAFYELLPLELDLADYSETEKVADLPKSLPEEGAASGMTPVVGDITYFAPWGNLAVFYKDFRHSRGLVKLGHIDGDISALAGMDNISVDITRYEESEK